MNKNKFNLHRCWSLLKGDLCNSRTDLLLLAGAVFLIVIAVALFSVFTPTAALSRNPFFNISTDEVAALSAMSNIGLVVLVAEAVIFSRVFANMSTRSGEARFLMLPATNGEKWLSRVLYVLLVGFVLVCAAYYLAVLCCGLLGLSFGIKTFSLLPNMLFDSNYVASLIPVATPWQATMFNFSSPAFFFAAFVLGGTWFRRVPWLYTALILLATFLVFSFAGGAIFANYFSSQVETFNLDDPADLQAFFDLLTPFFYVGSAVLLVLSVVMLWLSYRLFCRRQLEARKIRIIG